jgi:hypothetical protein
MKSAAARTLEHSMHGQLPICAPPRMWPGGGRERSSSGYRKIQGDTQNFQLADTPTVRGVSV